MSVDLDTECRKSGFDSSDSFIRLRDFVYWGTSGLKARHEKAREDYRKADPFDKQIAEKELKVVEVEIKEAREAIAQKTFSVRYRYTCNNNNVKRVDANTWKFPMTIPTEFTCSKAEKVLFPMPDVTGMKTDDPRNIELNVSGSEESIKKLVREKDRYRVDVWLTDLRHNSPTPGLSSSAYSSSRPSEKSPISANVLKVEIIDNDPRTGTTTVLNDGGKEEETVIHFTAIKGHNDGNSTVFSPDGKKIVMLIDGFGRGREVGVQIWDAELGEELQKLEGHTDQVRSASFSPDGTKIVTTSTDQTARIWDAKSGRELRKLMGHKSPVGFAVFSPDGNKIVTASVNGTIRTQTADGTARIWDVESGRELQKLEGHTGSITSAVFSPDGKKIVTTNSKDNISRIWDTVSGKELQQLIGHEGSVDSAAFSPDGKTIITTSSKDNTARIWDSVSGKELRKLDDGRKAVFSPDGKKIVTLTDWDAGRNIRRDGKIARIWDAESGQELQRLEGHTHRIYAAVFSPDGMEIVTVSHDKTVRIWNAESGKELQRWEWQEAFSVIFSPDGKKIVTIGSLGSARIWKYK